MSSYPFARNDAIWAEDNSYRPLYFNPDEMNVQERRLTSFRCWPLRAPDMRGDMAKEGLYYTGIQDIVQCFQCGKKFGKWRRKHRPSTRHQEESPDCPMVRGASLENVEFYANVGETVAPNHSEIKTSSSGTSGSSEEETIARLETDGHSAALSVTPKLKTKSCKRENLQRERHRQTPKRQTHEKTSLKQAQLTKVMCDMGFSEKNVHVALKKLSALKKDINSDELLDMLYEQHNEDFVNTSTTESTPNAAVPSDDSGNNADSEHSSSSSGEDEKRNNIEKKNTSIAQEKLRLQLLIARENCVVCHDTRAMTLFLPCAHKVTCEGCAKELSHCPKCNKRIRGTKQVFYA